MFWGREEERKGWDSGFILEVEPTQCTNGLDKEDKGNRKIKETEWLSKYSVARKEILSYNGILEMLLITSSYHYPYSFPNICVIVCVPGTRDAKITEIPCQLSVES